MDDGTNVHVSLDGVDFPIQEPQPFSRMWYSHKFKGAGLRYEIGISIRTGKIVWTYGGLPCGDWPDLKIAKESYIHCVKKGELTLADRGYNLRSYFKTPTTAQEKRILARHETLNGRLKQFGAMSQRFRHSKEKHPVLFSACINVVQVGLQNGEFLFEL